MTPMNILIKTSVERPFLRLAFVLIALALSPKAQAVSPPPDGGYPGGNTAEGQNALLSRTTGLYNTAVGIFSVLSLTDGNCCTGLGAGTLLVNTADANTATGAGALFSNTTGFQNTANGTFALFSNTDGGANTANGHEALFSNTGNDNTASGFQALFSNTDGQANTATGEFALFSNTIGGFNTAIGEDALVNNTTGTADTLPVLIDVNGQLGTAPSSRRFKKEIKPMKSASETILGLKPVTFHYKSDKIGIPQFGLIAEEVAAVNPDLVVRDKDGEVYTVRYDAVN